MTDYFLTYSGPTFMVYPGSPSALFWVYQWDGTTSGRTLALPANPRSADVPAPSRSQDVTLVGRVLNVPSSARPLR